MRARAGYLVTPTLLTYVTGGFAYGQTHVGASLFSVDTAGVFPPGSGATSYGSVHGGWTAGAGVEWMFWPQWSAKLEYLYYDLGAPSLGMTGIGYHERQPGHAHLGLSGDDDPAPLQRQHRARRRELSPRLGDSRLHSPRRGLTALERPSLA